VEHQTVREYVERVAQIERRATDLERDMHKLIPWQERVDADLYNHGKDGLKTQFTSFVSEQRGKENERDREHKANTARLNLIIALLGLLCAIVMTVLAVRGLNKTSRLLTGHMPATYETRTR
jgi:hypothetical protein